MFSILFTLMENTIQKVWIYALKDPRDNLVKYIGKSKDPKRRLKGHIYQCKFELTKKGFWIKKLLKLKLTPILEILKETDEDEYEHWEEFYIKKFLDEGAKLTNYDEKGIGTCKGMKKETLRKVKKKLSKKIYQYNLEGSFIREFKSLREAERKTNINHGNISKCCNEIYTHTGEYIFSFIKKDFLEPVINKKAEKKQVCEIDANGIVIEQYESIAEASAKTGIDASNISRVCNKKKEKTYNRYFIFKKEQ